MSYASTVAEILEQVSVYIAPVVLERIARPSPRRAHGTHDRWAGVKYADQLPKEFVRDHLQPERIPLYTMTMSTAVVDENFSLPDEVVAQHVWVPVEQHRIRSEYGAPQTTDWMRDALTGNPVRLQGKQWTITCYFVPLMSRERVVEFQLERLKKDVIE